MKISHPNFPISKQYNSSLFCDNSSLKIIDTQFSQQAVVPSDYNIESQLSNPNNDKYQSGIVSGSFHRNISNIFMALLSLWVRPPLSLDCQSAESLISERAKSGLLVEIGGGPTRDYGATNLNIGIWPNVDVVGDAHSLPYRDATVDNLMSRAVLEHLHSPELAVSEMFRVLKPGGYIFLAVPFLQPYHGYPNHFQGLTHTGLKSIAEKAGFSTVSFGNAFGPSHALSNLIFEYIKTYCIFGVFLSGLFKITLGALLSKIDLFLNRHPKSSYCSFGVYYLGFKNL